MPRVKRTEFLTRWPALWRQGEHILLLGPTGSGKTYLASELIFARDYVVVIAVKRYDDTLKLFKKQGLITIKSWPPAPGEDKVLLWLKPAHILDTFKQAERLHEALADIFLAGGWCVVFDELGYVCSILKCQSEVGMLLNQGRSSGISVVAATTRPTSMVARIPREALSQVRHIFVFKFRSQDEVRTIAKVVDQSYNVLSSELEDLEEHECLYFGPSGNFVLVK